MCLGIMIVNKLGYCDFKNACIFIQTSSSVGWVLSAININLFCKFVLSYRDWETDRKSTRLNSSH